MKDLVFRNFSEATVDAIPTVVGVDAKTQEPCIGEVAKSTASIGRPVIQDFKRRIGDTDAQFSGARPDSLWPIRPGAANRKDFLSTEEATTVFLRNLFAQIGPIPRQLVIGIPASTDEIWQRYYKAHLSKVLNDLGHPDPKFFPEPFAVFQYYRHCEKVIPDADHSQNILVIDIGGGTFDCCAIQTSIQGNLARKGSRASPLGIKSVAFAGKDIDRWLCEIALNKIKEPVLKKETPSARLQSHPYVLFLIEQMKIELSDKLHRLQSTLNDDCKNIVVSRPVAKGLYHPDLAFSLQLTGESLKSVILRAWKEHWGPALVGTLNDIKFRGGQVSIDTIEKVVLAGGSSHLAFIPQLVAKTLAGQVQFNPSDIVVGHHFQKAVAYGLAVEAREQRNTSLRSHDSIGPCIFSPLYFLVASERSSNLTAPSIRLAKSRVKRPDGALLDGPVQIANFTLDYEITLPFRPKKYFVYKFFDTPGADQNSEILPLNLEDDVVRVPANCPLTFSLSLHFGDDGVVRPHFDFGHDPIPARDFFFGGLQISREVESYAGIDFGTSNSYVVNLWSEPVARDIDYPTLTISESTGSHLRTLEEKIKQYQKMNLLNAETAKKLADDQRSRFIFNSIKIEGSPLTKGETEGAVSGSIPITTKELKEPVNVAQGYDFVRQNSSSYRETPEAFLRQLNKIVLDGISDDAGEYRVEAVKLSGMDFEPPPAVAVPPHMERLARELREGPGAKSTVHFAAEAHAKVTSIHPFADGNGRTARLLVNAILIDAGLCPVTIEFTEKERYLDCLKASNSKDLSLMCALISELIEESLDSLNPETIPEQNGVLPVVQAIVPPSASQRLAEAVRRKVAALTGQREARYGAWCGAFESFKQELSAASSLFNETYKLTSPFSIRVTMFDTLPLEKYDGIIQGAKTPKTWLTGCEINGDTKLEGFMFFFQAISYQFTDAARAEHVVLAPRDVSLAISRRTGGMYRRLLDEPVALREIAYADGQLVFLLAATSGKWQVSRSPISEVINNFFADSIEAFF